MQVTVQLKSSQLTFSQINLHCVKEDVRSNQIKSNPP